MDGLTTTVPLVSQTLIRVSDHVFCVVVEDPNRAVLNRWEIIHIYLKTGAGLPP